MLYFNLLTSQTFSHIFCNFPLHAMPPKLLFQIPVHFCASWVDRELRMVCFLKQPALQCWISRNTKSILVPQTTITTHMEFAYLNLLHLLPNLHNSASVSWPTLIS